jgi:photosystem II stability/assembly factor-like uncharacterized protein
MTERAVPRILGVLFTTLLLCTAIVSMAASHEGGKGDGPEPTFDAKLFKAMEFRSIGPYRGGRSTAVAGVVGDRQTYYFGSTGGGVWKSVDAGIRWRNVSDGQFESGSIGAIAVAPSDPNVVYVGTGSACPRGNVSPGNGMYRSTDAGETWEHVGLPEAGQIGRIRVHPGDPDLVYVAVLGHAFGPNEERGVFRSRDGGDSWDKVLFVSERAGAVDLAMDPNNPRILYAAVWQAQRTPWTMISGGEDSGLWKSTDGGGSWKELEDGLPKGTLGRIAVTVSGAKRGRVWALVEAEDGGLFRSENGGKSFRRINADRNFRQRAWYYTHVYADPRNANTVYILNVGMWRSDDGGKSFDFIRVPHGDNHDLWINPDDSQNLIEANDGGANVSFNGGRSWSTQTNQPTAEFYRVTVDDQFPYRVYGAQQDNSTVSIPSRTGTSGIRRQDWWSVGGCESGHIAVDPREPDVVYAGCYGGSITRYDHRTGQEREIIAYPQLALGDAAKNLRYRFQWNAPIRLSPHDPDVLYHCAQFVLRSRDAGQSWEEISPDLSRNDAERQDYPGGPITRDSTGVEVYGTIFAFEESPHQEGLLWAGTDDGRVHLSRDAGGSWKEITPERMPEWGQVNTIELSAHGAGRAFLAVTRYRLDDFRPYVFRTDDHGQTWSSLADGTNGIPEDHFVRVVREDPDRRGLLYAGTEFGVYVSFDDGTKWQPFQLELPVTPVTDMAVRHGDLVLSTQGRSFWILDDLSPLHQMTDEVAGADVHLFEPRDAFLFFGGGMFGGSGPAGKNPPNGAVVYYSLAEKLDDDRELTLEILDGDGNVLRRLSSVEEEPRAPNPWERFMPEPPKPRKLAVEEGLNRYVWDLSLADARLVDDAIMWGSAGGPTVPPGVYTVRMTLGDRSSSHDFEVMPDPRLSTTQEDYEARYALAKKAWEALSETHDAVRSIRDVQKQVEELSGRLEKAGGGNEVKDAARAVVDELTAVEDALIQGKNESSQDVLNFPPRIDAQLLAVLGAVESADARPTDGSVERFEHLRAELDGHQADLQQVLDTELRSFNDLVRSLNAPAVIVPVR